MNKKLMVLLLSGVLVSTNIDAVESKKAIISISNVKNDKKIINKIFSDEKFAKVIADILDKDVNDEVMTEDLESIKKVEADSKDISNISGIERLSNLEELNLTNNKISNIELIKDLEKLNSIDFSKNKIGDVPSLSKLTNLFSFKVAQNELTSIPKFSDVTKLHRVDLSKNDFNNFDNLSSLKNVRELDLNSSNLNSLNHFSNFENLEWLSADNNKLKSADGIEKIEKLSNLSIANNKISDVNVFKNTKKLTRLDISNNEIRDIQALDNGKLSDLNALNQSIKISLDKDVANHSKNGGSFEITNPIKTREGKSLSYVGSCEYNNDKVKWSNLKKSGTIECDFKEQGSLSNSGFSGKVEVEYKLDTLTNLTFEENEGSIEVGSDKFSVDDYIKHFNIKAIDSKDQDITKNIEIEDKVDYNTVGEYEVNVSIKNSRGSITVEKMILKVDKTKTSEIIKEGNTTYFYSLKDGAWINTRTEIIQKNEKTIYKYKYSKAKVLVTGTKFVPKNGVILETKEVLTYSNSNMIKLTQSQLYKYNNYEKLLNVNRKKLVKNKLITNYIRTITYQKNVLLKKDHKVYLDDRGKNSDVIVINYNASGVKLNYEEKIYDGPLVQSEYLYKYSKDGTLKSGAYSIIKHNDEIGQLVYHMKTTYQGNGKKSAAYATQFHGVSIVKKTFNKYSNITGDFRSGAYKKIVRYDLKGRKSAYLKETYNSNGKKDAAVSNVYIGNKIRKSTFYKYSVNGTFKVNSYKLVKTFNKNGILVNGKKIVYSNRGKLVYKDRAMKGKKSVFEVAKYYNNNGALKDGAYSIKVLFNKNGKAKKAQKAFYNKNGKLGSYKKIKVSKNMNAF